MEYAHLPFCRCHTCFTHCHRHYICMHIFPSAGATRVSHCHRHYISMHIFPSYIYSVYDNVWNTCGTCRREDVHTYIVSVTMRNTCGTCRREDVHTYIVSVTMRNTCGTCRREDVHRRLTSYSWVPSCRWCYGGHQWTLQEPSSPREWAGGSCGTGNLLAWGYPVECMERCAVCLSLKNSTVTAVEGIYVIQYMVKLVSLVAMFRIS